MASGDSSNRLDPETIDWLDKASYPNTGAVVTWHNGSILISAMLDANRRPAYEHHQAGEAVWRLVALTRKTKIHLSAVFRDKRFTFSDDGESHVRDGSVSNMELKAEEPHPERPVAFPDTRSRSFTIVRPGVDELTTAATSSNWGSLRLACRAGRPSASGDTGAKAPGDQSGIETKNAPRMKFLIYCTEWESGHGGLSTFNREFCLALAQLGHEVYLRIVTGGTIESQSNMLFRLEHSGSWRPQPYTGRLGMINPDVIVGHDRVSGKAMLHEAQQFMMSAKRFLFIHTDPRIEAYGDSDDRFAGTNLNRKLTLQDDLLRQTGWAIAVGPRLYRHVLERVSGFAPGPAVFRLDPGFCSRDEMRQVAHTADFRLLLIARPNDVELKGREIAIDAALLAKKGLTTQSTLLPSAERIHLGICGVSEPEMAKLARRLGNEGRISSYVVERGKIAEEFRRAHLVLMPSYEEGFGLVALEALEANRPVLATSNSGFAEFLREQFAETELGKFVEAMIVNEPSRIANAYSNSRSSTWADRIVESIQSYDSLADGVERIRAALSKKTWEHRVKQLLAQSF